MKRRILSGVMMCFAGLHVMATTYVWTGTSNLSFSTYGNWDPAPIAAFASYDTLVFDGRQSSDVTITNAGGDIDCTNGVNLVFTENQTNKVTLNNWATGSKILNLNSVTISNGAGIVEMLGGMTTAYGGSAGGTCTNVILNNSTNPASLGIAVSGGPQVWVVIDGIGDIESTSVFNKSSLRQIRKKGTGKWKFAPSGAGTLLPYGIVVEQGIVIVSGVNLALGKTANVSEVYDGGTFVFTNGFVATPTNTIRIQGSGYNSLGALNSAASTTNTLNGPLNMISNATVRVETNGLLKIMGAVDLGGYTQTVHTIGNVEIGAAVTNQGGVFKTGSGNLMLTASNCFNGTLSVVSGLVSLAISGALTDTIDVVVSGSGGLNLAAGTTNTVRSLQTSVKVWTRGVYSASTLGFSGSGYLDVKSPGVRGTVIILQ